jgi:hypothetical protein
MDNPYNLLESARKLIPTADARRFANRFPGHYLLGNVPDTDESEPDFYTGVLTPNSVEDLKSQMAAYEAELAARGGGDPDRLNGGPFLLEIKKHAVNAWSDWVSVGRAKNNDIVLTHSSVSKLHARIHTEQAQPEGDAEVHHLLTDTGSSLGTSVSGKLLESNTPRVLSPGDRIVFGEVECYFLDPPGLHRFLTAAKPPFIAQLS